MKRMFAAVAALLLAGVFAAQAIAPQRSGVTVPTREFALQMVHTQRATVNFNDPSISTGVLWANLPASAFIDDVKVEIVTLFNAGTTNVLTCGTTTTANELVNAADINEAATGVTAVTRGLGRSLTASGVTPLYCKYTQSGTAATTGQAIVTIKYIPNNDQ